MDRDLTETSSAVGEESHWIPLTDLMTGLMVIFLLIAVSYMMQVEADAARIKNVAIAYSEIKDALFDTGEVVPAGDGDGEIDRTNRALEADGFDGFFSMEPHLAQAGASGGFSGPELFAKATGAFTALLEAAGISYD